MALNQNKLSIKLSFNCPGAKDAIGTYAVICMTD